MTTSIYTNIIFLMPHQYWHAHLFTPLVKYDCRSVFFSADSTHSQPIYSWHSPSPPKSFFQFLLSGYWVAGVLPKSNPKHSLTGIQSQKMKIMI